MRRMPRPGASRVFEPLITIAWVFFLVASAWLAAVWALGINQHWLQVPIQGGEYGSEHVIDGPPPPHLGLRQALLLLARNAELIWLALALIQLHLVVVSKQGVNTGRTWLGIALGGSFLLASATSSFGLPFGHMHFTQVLGAKFLAVPLGWLLLWCVLLLSAREGVLRLRPRWSHTAATTAAAALVLLTLLNLGPIAREMRAWWFWYGGSLAQEVSPPAWLPVAWFAAAWVLEWLLRETNVAAAAKPRSWRPLVIVLLLNVSALITHGTRVGKNPQSRADSRSALEQTFAAQAVRAE